MVQEVMAKWHSTLSLQHGGVRVVNGLDDSLLCHHQNLYNTMRNATRERDKKLMKTHVMIVCSLARCIIIWPTVCPPASRSSSTTSSHSSKCGSTFIESSYIETSGTIAKSISPGTGFAAIPGFSIFWRM